MTELKKLSRSRIFQIIIGVIIFVLVLLFAFQAGRFVGFYQASFSGRLGDNYYQAFEGPGRRPMGSPRNFWADDLPNGHGAVGKIIKINLPTIIVVGPDQTEKLVKINQETLIRRFRESVKATELKSGDFVVVIGEDGDNDSQIEAKLIRLLPPPPAPAASTTNKQ